MVGNLEERFCCRITGTLGVRDVRASFFVLAGDAIRLKASRTDLNSERLQMLAGQGIETRTDYLGNFPKTQNPCCVLILGIPRIEPCSNLSTGETVAVIELRF